jgi:hypothetical protein
METVLETILIDEVNGDHIHVPRRYLAIGQQKRSEGLQRVSERQRGRREKNKVGSFVVNNVKGQ